MIERKKYCFCIGVPFWTSYPIHRYTVRGSGVKTKNALCRAFWEAKSLSAYIVFTAISSSNFCVARVISSIAFSNTASFLFDGFRHRPPMGYSLTFLTNCNAATRTTALSWTANTTHSHIINLLLIAFIYYTSIVNHSVKGANWVCVDEELEILY